MPVAGVISLQREALSQKDRISVIFGGAMPCLGNKHIPFASKGGQSRLRRLGFIPASLLLLFQTANGRYRELRPVDAEEAILRAFDSYPIVAVSEMHALQEEHDFIQSLLRNDAFPDKVNDIVLEAGNALYQDILDRYIAGEDVPMSEVRQVWRNTTVSPVGPWDAEVFEQIYTTVHEVNKKLPLEKRLRVLAGDPPIDWRKINSYEDKLPFLGERDRHFASVVEREVLAKGRKALLIIGGMHILKESHKSVERWDVTERIEDRYPGSTFVVWVHAGLLGVVEDKYDNQDTGTVSTQSIEKHLASWPIPSIATVKNTWLGELQLSLFLPMALDPHGQPTSSVLADGIDAYLYVGPKDSLTVSRVSSSVLQDRAYLDELKRRMEKMTGQSFMPNRFSNTRVKYFAHEP